MKVLMLDNFDSFTYNLVHYVEKHISGRVHVVRNTEIDLKSVKQYDKIILSPGPGLPEEKEALLPLIKEYAPSKSILGVCLGHQAIAQAFGGSLQNLEEVYHGIASPMTIIDRQEILFGDLPEKLNAGRYHSWIVAKETLPKELKITIEDEESRIMGLRHETYDVRGVQFHPESILTEFGEKMIANWLRA